MFRTIFFITVFLILSGCVLTPKSAENMTTAQLCSEAAYDSNRDVAFSELERRGVNFSNNEQCKIIYITKMQSFSGQQQAGAILLLGSQ
ncbi:Lipoprotein [Vibrio crassostreae]|uniref:hypothetical protein n=1 Tax=Vibrio crassostreae TaxID=246167 RepID=UPI0010E135F2|nr:hypothetical protein [Vibrio crassostreae]TCN75038.1 hypothetical protein EDB62_11955 [Vibrio crassostreae]TCN83180.1 hypothetical protein EDB37_101982 [Vibrio crassostreae]TWD65052.1 hypothetical protein FB445_11855 [Vibrio crassostreae]CAK2452800.1 Lipoprotein [Vibrio crassostreae]CAK2484941.1 Lipoprotein [Vibrio crassostreae]